jgi:hypothetical protein
LNFVDLYSVDCSSLKTLYSKESTQLFAQSLKYLRNYANICAITQLFAQSRNFGVAARLAFYFALEFCRPLQC